MACQERHVETRTAAARPPRGDGAPQPFFEMFDVNRFYPKTQLSWLARLDHSHCNSADPLTDGLLILHSTKKSPPARESTRSQSRPRAEAWRRRLRSLREPKCSSRSPLRPTRSSRTACTPLHANGTSSRARLYAFALATPHPCVARRMKVPEAAPFTAILKYAAEEVPAH